MEKTILSLEKKKNNYFIKKVNRAIFNLEHS